MTEAQPEEIDFIIADLELFTRLEIVTLALNVDANLRDSPPMGTPVDTGWARANWVPSIGEPYLAKSDDRDPSPAAIAARADIQAKGSNDILAWRPGDGPIFVSNNVPYIQALNAGHSTQSPPGFVQKALEKAVRETESSGANRAARQRRGAAAVANKKRPTR